jgi:phage tail sheath gpL-like
MALRTPSNIAVVTLTYLDEQVPAQAKLASHKRRTLEELAMHFEALAGGSRQGSVSILTNGGSNGTAATGTITMASSSGTVGAIINGVTVSVTWATSDTASSAALAAAINASVNALVQPFVSATSALGVTTLTAKNKGTQGNAVTLAATGTNVTASGARLTGGVDGTADSVTI